MNKLIIPFGSTLDNTLDKLWAQRPSSTEWIEFINTLEIDNSIKNIEVDFDSTKITFLTDAAKTWFLLKWT